MAGPGEFKVRDEVNLLAWRVPGTWDDEAKAVHAWLGEHGADPMSKWATTVDGECIKFFLDTVRGRDIVETGDWIILGVAGFFVRTDEQFRADYVEVVRTGVSA
jgi:hypothetical protein